MSTAEQRAEMAKKIVDEEARRDKLGHLVVYNPPADDGGGAFEVAGINERYDRPVATKLKALVQSRQYDAAEALAQQYIMENTDAVLKWADDYDPGVEFFLRDSVFNRGATGAAKILQIALGVVVDGEIGPKTKEALTEKSADVLDFLKSLRKAREYYEEHYVGFRSNLWHGLENRWNNALAFAEKLTGENSAVAYREQITKENDSIAAAVAKTQST
jgi:lysozyme family protein